MNENPDADLWSGIPRHRPWGAIIGGVVLLAILIGGGFFLVDMQTLDTKTASSQVPATTSTSNPLASASQSASPKASATSSPSASTVRGIVPLIGTTAAACHLPTSTDTVLGYTTAQPTGWSREVTNGTVILRHTQDDAAIGFVYPLQLAAGVDGQTALLAYKNLLIDDFKQLGATIKIDDANQLSGTYRGATIQGLLTARTGDGVLVLAGGWSKDSSLPGLKETYLALGDCFSLVAPTGLKLQSITANSDRGAVTYQLGTPDDWPSTTNDQSLTLTKAPQTDLSVIYQSGLLGNQTSDGYVTQYLGSLTDAKALTKIALPAQTDSQGNAWEGTSQEYTATDNGKSVRGLLRAYINENDDGSGFGNYVVYAVNMEAPSDQWLDLFSVESFISSSIVITNDMPGKDLIFASATNHFDDVLFSQDIYSKSLKDVMTANGTSVLSGHVMLKNNTDTYWAPLSAYLNQAPGGLGYYLNIAGSVQKVIRGS